MLEEFRERRHAAKRISLANKLSGQVFDVEKITGMAVIEYLEAKRIFWCEGKDFMSSNGSPVMYTLCCSGRLRAFALIIRKCSPDQELSVQITTLTFGSSRIFHATTQTDARSTLFYVVDSHIV